MELDMHASRFRLAALAVSGALALSGCAYGLYGDGYGYHPYGGVSIGVGYGGYGGYGYAYDPYYGYGGYDPFGWYGDYYYPGVGVYVYDRHHNRHAWTDQQRRYWEDRRSHWQTHHGTAVGTAATTENWTGWDRTRSRNSTRSSGDRGSWRADRSSGQSRSSESTRGTSSSSSASSQSAGQRSAERADERPQ